MTEYRYIAAPNNSLAVASFVLGLIVTGGGFLMGLFGFAPDPLSIILFLVLISVPGILAIVFGFIGISTANRMSGKRRKLAIWGVVLGFVPVVGLLLGGFIGSVLFG